MIIKTATYIKSSPDLKNCPPRGLSEFAFTGRSNVGKSSLINMLTGNKSLAKISGKPGKTRLMNFFIINDAWRLVDLPGYGYAGVSKDTRSEWIKMIGNYLTQRENLLNTFVLIDSRLKPQKIDLEYINWLGEKGLPFCIVFTKVDKISSLELKKNIDAFREKLMESWEECPPYFTSSAIRAEGKDDILGYVENILKSSSGYIYK